MINKDICDKVLFIGIDPRSAGGIAAVASFYRKFFNPYHYIATVEDGSKFKKLLVMMRAVVAFSWSMVFQRNIEIVHVHASSGPSFWRKRTFINIAKLFGKKVVYHMHSGGFADFAKSNMKRVNRLLNKCDLLIVLTPYWRDYFRNTHKIENLVVLPNGIEMPEAFSRVQQEYPLRMTYLGKICDDKGVFDLLDVISDLKKESKEPLRDKLLVSIGGNGEAKRLMERIRDLKIDDVVAFHGWVNGPSKKQLMMETDIFILPSYYEGMPISLLEAMSYGQAIIATPVGGVPEIIEDGVNGLLFTPGNKSEMANCIKQLVQNPDAISQMGKVSLEKSKQYSSDNISSRLEAIYRKVLARV